MNVTLHAILTNTKIHLLQLAHLVMLHVQHALEEQLLHAFLVHKEVPYILILLQRVVSRLAQMELIKILQQMCVLHAILVVKLVIKLQVQVVFLAILHIF